jgi:SAM-dependent methyltransferase
MSLSSCPGCDSSALEAELRLERQPVILNYRFASPAEARAVPRRDLHLRECGECGLIFNAALDEAAIPYDQKYENRQTFSPAFLELLEQTADTLGARYGLAGGTVLEVGCGKGDFLRLLCRRAGARGFGYDTSYEARDPHDDRHEEDGVRFFRRYVTADDVRGELRLVVCRHVVEHVSAIGGFLRLLRDISRAGGGAPIYVETPAWDWITDTGAFWDVFYEHCNYFPTTTLRRLAELAGLATLDQRLIFGGQYQALELRPLGANERVAITAPPAPSLARFAASFEAARRSLEARLREKGSASGWAIWGAGAKGVCLANALEHMSPSFVIDSNPAKQGMFIPGTDVPVIAPSDARVKDVSVILIANGNYLAEIQAVLTTSGILAALLVI